MWTDDRRFGVEAQDEIDIDGLINEPRAVERPRAHATELERRSVRRISANTSVAQQMERSRQISATFQFVLFVAVGAVVAGCIATTVYDFLEKPFHSAAERL
jgi:hypothetical protein